MVIYAMYLITLAAWLVWKSRPAACRTAMAFATIPIVLAVNPVKGFGQDHNPEIKPLVRVLETKHLAEQRENECRLSEARALYVAAGESLKDIGGASFSGAGAGVTHAEIDDRIVKVDERQKVISRESRKAADALKRGQVETALNMWQDYNGPACDPELGAKLQQARARALELATQGDAEADLKRRLQVYLDAFHINSQTPGLYQKLSQTHQQVDQIPCNACRAAGRTVKTVVILGAIGGLGFLGWTEYQHYEKTHP